MPKTPPDRARQIVLALAYPPIIAGCPRVCERRPRQASCDEIGDPGEGWNL
jgi:hypothetical protein